MKNTRIAKGKGRSDKEWDDVALKVGMAMLSMQLVPEAVRALGPRQRRMAVALETKVVGQLSRGAAFRTSLTTKTAFYAEVKALLPLIASHLNKSKAPLQIAASWIVPRPATHMWVPVEKGAARQRVTEHLVESWMLASIPPRKCHSTASESKSGPLRAPGHDQKKTGACVIVRALIQAFFVGSEGGVKIGEEYPLRGSACPYCCLLAQDHRRGR